MLDRLMGDDHGNLWYLAVYRPRYRRMRRYALARTMSRASDIWSRLIIFLSICSNNVSQSRLAPSDTFWSMEVKRGCVSSAIGKLS